MLGEAPVDAAGEQRGRGGKISADQARALCGNNLDLPPATIKSVGALSAGVASGAIVLDHGARRADLIASLIAVTAIEPATAHQIALRLGHRSRHGTPVDEGRGSVGG